MTGTATNGLGLGLASTFVMVTAGVALSLLRGIITPQVRIPVFVLVIAVLVTLVDLGMNAWLHDLHQVLGLFIPLIVTNCAILGRVESFASRRGPLPAAFDGLMMGLGFTFALVLLGALREIIGSGTLFQGAGLLLGETMTSLELTLIPDYRGFLLAILPPGSFVVLGLVLAGKRLVDAPARPGGPRGHRSAPSRPAEPRRNRMNIGIAYADRFDRLWLRLEVPDGSTIEDAIHRSGLLQRFPDIDLSRQKVGIFGKITKLSAEVRDGDRVEIYRDIVADPQTTPRRDSD